MYAMKEWQFEEKVEYFECLFSVKTRTEFVHQLREKKKYLYL